MDGKIIAITGGASGIGLATAKLLASRGATVALADVNQAGLDKATETIKQAGGKVTTAIVDVRERQQVEQWIGSIVKEFGKLDGAANMAGVLSKKPGYTSFLKDYDDEEFEMIVAVNIKGMFHCLRAELSVMASGAAIVNASSVGGLIGSPGNGAYCASKHAVIGLTKSAAKEAGNQNIRVNAVAPGIIDTQMTQPLFEPDNKSKEQMTKAYESSPLGRKGEAEEVAALVAFLLGKESGFMTGGVYTVDGGMIC